MHVYLSHFCLNNEVNLENCLENVEKFKNPEIDRGELDLRER